MAWVTLTGETCIFYYTENPEDKPTLGLSNTLFVINSNKEQFYLHDRKQQSYLLLDAGA